MLMMLAQAEIIDNKMRRHCQRYKRAYLKHKIEPEFYPNLLCHLIILTPTSSQLCPVVVKDR